MKYILMIFVVIGTSALALAAKPGPGLKQMTPEQVQMQNQMFAQYFETKNQADRKKKHEYLDILKDNLQRVDEDLQKKNQPPNEVLRLKNRKDLLLKEWARTEKELKSSPQ